MMKHLVLYLVLSLTTVLQAFTFPGTQEVTAEVIENRVVVTYHIPENMHQIASSEFFTMDVEPTDGVIVSDLVKPEDAIEGKFGAEYHGKTMLSRSLYGDGTAADSNVTVVAQYQLCDENGTCFMPQKKTFELKLPSALPEKAAESVDEAPKPKVGLFVILGMAFLGGLILNLMPCVLPVLSIKMMSIVQSAHKSKKEILKGSFAYAGGILASFAVLAAVIVTLKASGEAVGWGFQFQSPGFVFAVLILIWVFALSLFDVFMIKAPGATMADKASSQHGHFGSFTSGIFAVVLATPCTAPLLGSAIGLAFQQSAVVIVITLLIVGVGLAFPFIILGFFPDVMKFIPRPGNWMNTFREVMGFLLFGTAVFLARSLSSIVSKSQFNGVLWFLVILSFACWLYGKFSNPIYSKKKQVLGSLVAIGIVASGCFVLIDSDNSDWQGFSGELVEKLTSEDKAVFVDFGAEWCMTCQTNKKLVLHTESMHNVFKEHDVELVYGDFTRKNPEILRWLQKFNKSGVPLYLLYKPGEKEPVIFPEIITKGMIEDELENIKKK